MISIIVRSIALLAAALAINLFIFSSATQRPAVQSPEGAPDPVEKFYPGADRKFQDLIGSGIDPITASCALGIRAFECNEVPGY
jgi:hypothetical protein